MIHVVTRDAVTVILPPMLFLAEVVLHAAPVLPPEKIQVKACLLHRLCEYTYILGALAKIYSGTQERSKWTRGDSTYAAGY
jgi:hypothetical protein